MVGGTARFLISGSSDSRSSQHNGLISLVSRISKILYSFVQSPLSLHRHTQKTNHMEKRETLHFSLITCIKKVRFSLLDCVCTAHACVSIYKFRNIKVIWGYSTGVGSQNLAANFSRPPQVWSWRCFSPGLQSL